MNGINALVLGFMLPILVIATGFLLWLYTPKGKRWLNNLD